MYFALCNCTFKQLFQYRGDLFLRVIGSFLWIYIQVCIWGALLGAGSNQGVTLKDMISYTVISFLITILTRSSASSVLAQRVRDGSIAVELIRPVNLKWYLFFVQFSQNIFYLLFTGAPLVFLSILLWGIKIPILTDFIIFLVCICFSVLIMFYFQFIVGLLVFWVKGDTVSRMIANGLFTLFSGATIPLWFYPDALAKICRVLPFRLITFEPASIFLGKYPLQQSFKIIGLQILWLFAFAVIEKIAWGLIQKRIFVQGG